MTNTQNLSFSLMEPSKFRINTQYFSPYDLSLFVESIETLTRLTRAKEERKGQQQMQPTKKIGKKFSILPCISSRSTVDSNSSSSSSSSSMENLGDEIQQLLLLEKKKLPCSPEKSDYDECYCSATNSFQSSPRSSVISQQQFSKKSSCSKFSLNTKSDSEESGVFPIGSSQQNLHDPTIKSRSKINIQTRSLSMRARLINLIKKKEKNETPTVELISCRTLDEYETLKIYEQQQKKQEQILRNVWAQESEKLARFSTVHLKKKARQGFALYEGSSEERLLDKAMRYLTL